VAVYIRSFTVVLHLTRTVSFMTSVCLRTELLAVTCFPYTPCIMFTIC